MLITEQEPALDLHRWPDGAEDKSDLETSYAVLNEFFSWYTLEDIRHYLWQFFKTALENDTQSAEPRANMIFLYEQIRDLVAAAYVIAREKQSKKLGKKSSDNKKGHNGKKAVVGRTKNRLSRNMG